LVVVNRERAARELGEKLRLEAELRPRVRAARRSLVREVTRSFGRGGSLPDVASISEKELGPILLDHYGRVGEKFSRTIGEELPSSLRATPREEGELSGIMALLFEDRAPKQAREIASTDEKNAKTSVEVAGMERLRIEEEEGRSVTRLEEALIVGIVLGRRLQGREQGIVTRETQVPAEMSKMSELQVLLNLPIPFPGGRRRGRSTREVPEKRVFKGWVSQGDSRVRTPPDSAFDHLKADSGQVPVDEPFIVSGEKLMHPGDESLGASKGNIAGCRCSSQVDVEEVASARMRMVEEEAPVEGAKPREDAKTSTEKWKDENGNWLPERRKLHDEIVDDFTKNAISVPEGEEKVFHMVAGGTASGKGTVIGAGKVELPRGHVKVDADEIKARLPEFVEGRRVMDPGAAGFVHLESSYLSERIMQRSVEFNTHVVLDGVGDGGLEKISKRVNRFKASGYKVKGDYVTVPTDVAVQRARERALSGGTDPGRQISETVTRSLHKGVSQDFPRVSAADVFDELHLYDTNIPVGAEPRLIFSKVRGEDAVIHDETLWGEFLAKAAE